MTGPTGPTGAGDVARASGPGAAGGWQPALPLAGGRPPRWAEDPRLAQVAWSRLAEPEDQVALRFVAARGPVAALERLASPAPVTPGECDAGEEPRSLAAGLARWRVRLPETDPERDLAAVAAAGGRAVLPDDPQWPAGLDDLGDVRPFVLWVRGGGDPAALCARSAALVGARACTAYGERLASELAAGAGDRGVTTVSGAALGIDGAAHRGALAVGAPTVAVLACGVERAYPRSHDRLLAAIAEEGAVLSELPPGSSPMRRRFLERNRLIAAASRATVVVEAGWRSGSLATANRALVIGRHVGAVPGPVTSASSSGCHRLLRSHDEVACITDADELVQLVAGVRGDSDRDRDPGRAGPAQPHDGLGELGRAVLDALPAASPRPLDRLAVTAGLPVEHVRAALGELSFRGLAVQEPGGWRRGGLDARGGGR